MPCIEPFMARYSLWYGSIHSVRCAVQEGLEKQALAVPPTERGGPRTDRVRTVVRSDVGPKLERARCFAGLRN